MPMLGGLARFLHLWGMNQRQVARNRIPVEDRIDELSRVVLVVLLIATLASVL